MIDPTIALMSLEGEDNVAPSAQILEFPPLWQAQADVREYKRRADYFQHVLDTDGAERMDPIIAVNMAKMCLPEALQDLRKAEAKVVALTEGTALTYNGILYATTAGRA